MNYNSKTIEVTLRLNKQESGNYDFKFNIDEKEKTYTYYAVAFKEEKSIEKLILKIIEHGLKAYRGKVNTITIKRRKI